MYFGFRYLSGAVTMRDYKAFTLSLHTIAKLIVIANKKVKAEYPDFQILLKDAQKGNIAAVMKLKSLVYNLLEQLESIKQYARKDLFEDMTSFSDIAHALVTKHVLESDLSDNAKDIASQVLFKLQEDKQRQKKESKRTSVRLKIQRFFFNENKTINRDIKVARLLEKLEKRESKLYRKIHQQLQIPITDGQKQKQIHALIAEYLEITKNEVQSIFYLMKNDELIEHNLIKDIQTLARTNLQDIKQVILELDDKYKRLLRKDALEDKYLLHKVASDLQSIAKKSLSFEEYFTLRYKQAFDRFFDTEDIFVLKNKLASADPILLSDAVESDIKKLIRLMQAKEIPLIDTVGRFITRINRNKDKFSSIKDLAGHLAIQKQIEQSFEETNPRYLETRKLAAYIRTSQMIDQKKVTIKQILVDELKALHNKDLRTFRIFFKAELDLNASLEDYVHRHKSSLPSNIVGMIPPTTHAEFKMRYSLVASVAIVLAINTLSGVASKVFSNPNVEQQQVQKMDFREKEINALEQFMKEEEKLKPIEFSKEEREKINAYLIDNRIKNFIPLLEQKKKYLLDFKRYDNSLFKDLNYENACFFIDLVEQGNIQTLQFFYNLNKRVKSNTPRKIHSFVFLDKKAVKELVIRNTHIGSTGEDQFERIVTILSQDALKNTTIRFLLTEKMIFNITHEYSTMKLFEKITKSLKNVGDVDLKLFFKKEYYKKFIELVSTDDLANTLFNYMNYCDIDKVYFEEIKQFFKIADGSFSYKTYNVKSVFNQLEKKNYKTHLSSDLFFIAMHSTKILNENIINLILNYNITHFHNYSRKNLDLLKKTMNTPRVLKFQKNDTPANDILLIFRAKSDHNLAFWNELDIRNLDLAAKDHDIYVYEVSEDSTLFRILKEHKQIAQSVINAHGTQFGVVLGFTPQNSRQINYVDALATYPAEDHALISHIKGNDAQYLDVFDNQIANAVRGFLDSGILTFKSCSTASERSSKTNLILTLARWCKGLTIIGAKNPICEMEFTFNVLDTGQSQITGAIFYDVKRDSSSKPIKNKNNEYDWRIIPQSRIRH